MYFYASLFFFLEYIKLLGLQEQLNNGLVSQQQQQLSKWLQAEAKYVPTYHDLLDLYLNIEKILFLLTSPNKHFHVKIYILVTCGFIILEYRLIK